MDSTCSPTVIGTAGLCSLRGTDPVIATVMMHGVVISKKQKPCASSLQRHAAALLVRGHALGAALLQILLVQKVVVEVDFRQAQLRFAVIVLGLEFRLPLLEHRHAALAPAAEFGSFRTGLRNIQPYRFALAVVPVENEAPRAILLFRGLLDNALALAVLQLDEALGAGGFNPWRRFALLGPRIVFKALLALDRRRWRWRNPFALVGLRVQFGAFRAFRFIIRNALALFGIIGVADKPLRARCVAFVP